MKMRLNDLLGTEWRYLFFNVNLKENSGVGKFLNVRQCFNVLYSEIFLPRCFL